MTSVLEIHLSAGDILYSEGDSNEHAYVIETGEVILYRTDAGQRINVERRGAGAIIGELSILTSQPRTVTVEALTTCTVYRISADRIRNRFERIDPILRACIDTSINFAATFTRQTAATADTVPIAESTLRNAGDLIEQFRLETDILRGLDRGEFSLVFQPIVQLADGAIIGCEALMRWQHPQLGEVSPDHFIPVAETTGSIKRITELAIVEGCAALRRLRALDGAPEALFLSINVSGKDIVRTGFVDFLAFVLDTNDLAPAHLRLEITETALIDDFEIAEANFQRLRALGCGVSIDDFGTGHSNFAYLKSLPITALKIDRTFVADAHSNPVSHSIVSLMIQLGRDLEVDVIAEGLETDAQVQTLQRLGCHLAQGYHFYKPLPERDVTEIIAGRAATSNVA